MQLRRQTLIHLTLLLAVVDSATVTFEIDEDEGDSASYREVGRLNSGNSAGGRQKFELVQSGTQLFSLHSVTGVLTTRNSTVDRERLCASGEFAKADACPLKLLVRAGNALLNIVVRVRDLNDNSPTFADDNFVVRVAENSPMGETFRLPTALDPDSRANAVRQYSSSQLLRDFIVEQVDVNGTPEPRLVVIGSVDRELEASVTFDLVATDGGGRHGKLAVTVEIVDINDHAPAFTQPQATVRVTELLPPRENFLAMNATDADFGDNARIRFSVRDVTGHVDSGRFGIDVIGGGLFLTRRLDYEKAQKHVLVVEAVDRDGGRLAGAAARTGTATVTVSVQAANDVAPAISVTAVGDSPADAAQGELSVSEDAKVDTQVALVTVSDADLDGADRLTCELSDEPAFRLVPRATLSDVGVVAEFEVRTVEPLDRERRRRHRLRIRCLDNANPPLEAATTVTVKVINVNDNAPVFAAGHSLRLRVEENAEPGLVVAKLKADDADGDSVVFELVDTPDAVHFRLQPDGTLSTVGSFDREQTAEFHLRAVAMDTASPPLTSEQLEIVVQVADVNDNTPQFDKNQYEFSVHESASSSVEPEESQLPVGIVHADDADADDNGRVEYAIADLNARGRFSIDRVSGAVKALVRLDREEKSQYQFSVTATDCGTVKRNTAVASVTVVVLDTNDNSPRFIFPSPENGTVVATSLHGAAGSPVADVMASDSDAGGNSALLYFIAAGNDAGAFSLDAHTGRLTLARRLRQSDAGSHRLLLEAADNGSPQRRRQATLTVIVRDIPASVQFGVVQRRWGVRAYAMLGCLLAFGCVLALACLATVVWLRRRRHEMEEKELQQQRQLQQQQAVSTMEKRFATLPLPHCLSDMELGGCRTATAGQPTAAKASGHAAKVQAAADGNFYYRIPASDDNYDSRQRFIDHAAHCRTAHRTESGSHGYQVLQPAPAAATLDSRRHQQQHQQRPSQLQVDGVRDARRGGGVKSFQVLNSSFV